MSTPIYHQVCEDLGMFPLAMQSRFRTHSRFMRDHGYEPGDTTWIDAAWHKLPPPMRTKVALRTPSRQRQPRPRRKHT